MVRSLIWCEVSYGEKFAMTRSLFGEKFTMVRSLLW